MDNRAVIEKIMRNLAFEVETISDSETIQESSNSSKLDPLNVKIKVRKKEMNEQYNRGFISNNQSEPERVPQKVRVITSGETIMSFDMFMEADEKKISPKPRKHIFGRLKPGICLGATTDEDNQPYMPNFNNSIKVSQDSQLSKSDGKLRQQFTLSKNNCDTFHKSPTKRTERTFLGRKCKPGGCLDPPFNEDIYAYKPVVETPLLPDPSNDDNIIDYQEERPMNSKLDVQTPNKNERKPKDTPISINPVDSKVKKSGSIQNLSNMEPIRNAVTPEDSIKDINSYKLVAEAPLSHESDNADIADHRKDTSIHSKLGAKAPNKSKRKSKDTSFSFNPVNDQMDNTRNSIITYPPDDNSKEMKTTVFIEDKSRQSINESINAFFSPPKGIKRDSNNQVQRDLPKRHSSNPKSIKDKPVEYIPLPSLSLPVPITASLNSVPVKQSSASEVMGNINPNEDIKNKQLIPRVPSSKDTEYKSHKPGDIPFQVDKELLDFNMDDTDSSNLITDTKRISIAPINDKIRYPNIDEKVSSGNMDDQVLPSTHSQASNEIATTPKKYHDTNQKQTVINEIVNLADESKINTKEEYTKNFAKIESFTNQPSNETEISLLEDKIGIEVKSKDDEEQKIIIQGKPEVRNHDTQSPKTHKASNVSDGIDQHFDLDSKIKKSTTSKDIIEILSISDQKSKLQSNFSGTFQQNKDVNIINMDSNNANVSSDEEYTLYDRTPQSRNLNSKVIYEEPQIKYPGPVSDRIIEPNLTEPKIRNGEDQRTNDTQGQEKDIKWPSRQILVPEVCADVTSTQKHTIKDTVLEIHENDMRDKDKVLSSGPAVPSVDSSKIEPKTAAPIKSKDKHVITLPVSDGVVTADLKTVSFNLAFHKYLNNKNERIFKTIPNHNDIYRYPNDSIIVINSQIKVSSEENLPELNIPIDSMFDMTIKIKSNDQKQKIKCENNTVPDKPKTEPISTFPSSAKTLNVIPDRNNVEWRVRTQRDQNDTVLHRTLTEIYEQELVPLQTMIRTLKAEIDYLAEQRTVLKKKLICPKKSLHRNKRIS